MSGNVIESVQHIPFVILDQPRLWAFYTDKIHQTDSHKMSGKVLIIVSADLNVMECIILTAAYWLFYIIPSHLCLLDDSTRNLSKWLLPVLCLESGQRLLRIEDSLHAKRSGASATIATCCRKMHLPVKFPFLSNNDRVPRPLPANTDSCLLPTN